MRIQRKGANGQKIITMPIILSYQQVFGADIGDGLSGLPLSSASAPPRFWLVLPSRLSQLKASKPPLKMPTQEEIKINQSHIRW